MFLQKPLARMHAEDGQDTIQLALNLCQERVSGLQNALTHAIIGVINVFKAHLISQDPSTETSDAALGLVVAVGLS